MMKEKNFNFTFYHTYLIVGIRNCLKCNYVYTETINFFSSVIELIVKNE